MTVTAPELDEIQQPSLNSSFAALYADLRRLAHAKLRHSEPITLLDTTSLVHEAYLKLLRAGPIETAEQSKFLAYMSRAMRSIIVDFIRQRRAERRGVGQPELLLDAARGISTVEEEIMRVAEALNELEKADERLVKIVEMRYFGGFSEEEIAESLDITDRTVRRDWKRARLLLSMALR